MIDDDTPPPERNPRSATSKDIADAAVLMASLGEQLQAAAAGYDGLEGDAQVGARIEVRRKISTATAVLGELSEALS